MQGERKRYACARERLLEEQHEHDLGYWLEQDPRDESRTSSSSSSPTDRRAGVAAGGRPRGAERAARRLLRR